ncbi:PEP-CTERM sorting domain-containing protein [Alginatibacterium sediminis]|uniref:PEP-CTERM sorting domain-containing protein n=1 Tax=Alginatibacterium sediminis TaxID=2164068 RepID=A0A420EHC3_9ALTE|nr:PEP-CTERM sorting domain-containing protein [Alginatibacterium sediminis]RKF19956.1 PEP-CTERM sorting domain-containing protein [Alginatibacterium sediminis]
MQMMKLFGHILALASLSAIQINATWATPIAIDYGAFTSATVNAHVQGSGNPHSSAGQSCSVGFAPTAQNYICHAGNSFDHEKFKLTSTDSATIEASAWNAQARIVSNNTATSFADLETGVLKTYTKSSPDRDIAAGSGRVFSVNNYAIAEAWLEETLHFKIPVELAGLEIIVNPFFNLHAEFLSPTSPSDSWLTFNALYKAIYGGAGYFHSQVSDTRTVYDNTNIYKEFDVILQHEREYSEDVYLSLNYGMHNISTSAGEINALNTASTGIKVPFDLQFTSGSQVYLSKTPDESPVSVPEPSSMAVFLLSILAMGFRVRASVLLTTIDSVIINVRDSLSLFKNNKTPIIR